MPDDPMTYEMNPKLQDFCEKIRKDYFPELKVASFNCIFRTKEKKDREGRTISGDASALSSRERDLYGFDFQICIDKAIWSVASSTRREQLMWHELKHCFIKTDDRGVVLEDKAGRIKIGVIPHEIVLHLFTEELDLFGLTPGEAVAVRKASTYLGKAGEKGKRKLRRRRQNQ